jgi:glycosyltransferase involved in cell wall biosynthesis
MPSEDFAVPRKLISVVIPAYNEQEVLEEFHTRLAKVLDDLPFDAEAIYVNDGSSDSTLELIRRLSNMDPRVALVDLSRNFGKEAALTAGIRHAAGDAVVVIDADLQDPPELIAEFCRVWEQEGAEVVYGQRTAREGETRLKKITASIFYRLMQRVGSVKLPPDTGDFRLIDRRAVDALNQLTEHHRFMKGLFTWIGFEQKAVRYRRDPRYAGETKWNYWRLWNFALEGITSYSVMPLKIASYFGVLIALLSLVYGAFIVLKTLVYGDPVPGYPSLIVVVLFLGGIQLLSIGIVGEYLARIFNETKRRPLYLVKSYVPSATSQGRPTP